MPQISLSPPSTDTEVLTQVTDAVRHAGRRLLDDYSPSARPAGRTELFAALERNDEHSTAVLADALRAARPHTDWLDEAFEQAPLPAGEHWVVDAVEGNINHIHGLPEWAVTAALVRDQVPVLAAVYQPIGEITHTAMRGEGAFRGTERLAVSTKVDLAVALVATGQAEAGQTETYGRIGASVSAMLEHTLLVRVVVPSTFPLLMVAAGHLDAFWQFDPVLPGVVAGALMVEEAGGTVTDLAGKPWRPGSPSFLAAAPGVHGAIVDALEVIA